MTQNICDQKTRANRLKIYDVECLNKEELTLRIPAWKPLGPDQLDLKFPNGNIHIDLFPKRHKLVHNGGFPQFKHCVVE